MNSPNAIQVELTELSSNLPFENKQPVFTVPEGYFENFAAAVWAKINSQHPNTTDELKTLSPVLAAIPKKMPFSVPENYFQSLGADLPRLVEEEVLPDVLQHASRQLPYTVPSGYFNDLAGTLLQKTAPKKAKVISMAGRFTRYAVAAGIAGLVALGGILYFSGKQGSVPVASEQWVAKKLENVSNKDLDAFISTADVNPGSGELAGNSKREVRKMLNDVSTSELEAFLNEVPTDNEELSVIN